MRTCSRCKNTYAEFRTGCPACGLSAPRRSKPYVESKSAFCASCDRPRATVECVDCGEMVHKGCYERHMSHHADEIAAMYDEAITDR